MNGANMKIIRLRNLSARAPDLCDAEAIASLIGKCDDGVLRNEADILTDWQQPGFVLANDARIITTQDKRIVGYVAVYQIREQSKAREGSDINLCAYLQTADFTLCFTLCVDPDYRERGIETLLLRLIEARARQLLAVHVQGARTVSRICMSRRDQALRSLLVQDGYTPVWYFWRLRISMDQVVARSTQAEQEQPLFLDVALHIGDTEPKVPSGPCEGEGTPNLIGYTDMYEVRHYDVFEKVLSEGPCQEVDQSLQLYSAVR